MQESEITGIAKQYMGDPTPVTGVFAATISCAYGYSVYAGITGMWPMWLAFFVTSYLAFMAYTPLHESVHQNICGREKRYRWLNDLVGYTMASILGFSFHIHKWAHRVHHQVTNVPGADPDHVFKGQLLYDTVLGGVLLVGNEYRMYFTDAFPKLDTPRKSIVLAEIATFVGWRMVLAVWFPNEVLLLCVLSSIAGVTWLVIIFAWLVHIPFDQTQRYRDTSTYLLPKAVHRAGTWLWLWQNYHTIHHLFPRIAFYKYETVFNRIEPGLRERGTPIHSIGHTTMQEKNPS